jgi:hypothetical protein
MADPGSDEALRVLFGRAFLVALRRGNLETAKLFARAFLSRGIGSADSLIAHGTAQGVAQ